MKPTVPSKVQIARDLIDRVPVGDVMLCLKEHAEVVRHTPTPRCKPCTTVVETDHLIREKGKRRCLHIRTETGETMISLSRVRLVRNARRARR